MEALGNMSGYSFYGACWEVEALVAAARASGYTVVGLSDAGGLWGGVEFSQACGASGMGMVLGCRMAVRQSWLGPVQMVARDERGYAAIARVVSEATAGELEWEQLVALQREAARHIWLSWGIGLQSGYAGRVSRFQRWLGGWRQVAEQDWPNVWVELGWANEAERLLQRRVFSELSRGGWQRWVAMTNARYGSGDWRRGGIRGQDLLELLQSVGTLTRLGQRHPDKLEPGDYGLLTPAQLRARFARVPEVLAQTAAYAAACRFDYNYGRLNLPSPQAGNANRKLAWLCGRGLKRVYGSSYPWGERPTHEALWGRLRQELTVVAATGYAGYFLIFAELVAECGARGIPVLARGSAAGSLICYTLGVSNVCPFRFNLCFERFLNEDRLRHSKLPDIDLDLPWDRREEMVAWVYERYGLEHVAMIGGFAHFQGRAALVEVAKVLGATAAEAQGWSKRLPHGSLAKLVRQPESYVEARGALADARFQEALALAQALEGLPRHPMMHPCGIVIADRDLRHFTPLIKSGNGLPMTQMSMQPIEDMGLLKMDLLGQAGLSVLRDCLNNLRADGQIEPGAEPLAGLDYGDAAIYALMRQGEARGVFHIESPAMTSLLKLCRCADIDCLVAAVSVIRPGAANEDKKTRFARRYLGLEQPEFAHPVLAEVLGDTFGLMVYEEHILLVAHRFAGMDLGTADRLRRILIKKAEGSELEQLAAVFRSSAYRLGRSEAEVDAVWQQLYSFTGYMFNKAHGAAYALEAYHGCWLKAHWPIHYLAAVLNNRRGFYAPLVYVLEILRRGGEFRLPDVQEPGGGYFVRGGRQVQIPLWQVHGLGDGFLRRWQRARERGRFTGWQDFVARCRPESAEAELLARVGALREFFANRHEAAWQAMQLGRAHGRQAPAGRRGMAGSDSGAGQTLQLDLQTPAAAVTLPPTGTAEAMQAEMELLGFPVSGDPFNYWLDPQLTFGTMAIAQLPEFVGREVEIAGLQVCQRLHRTQHGDMMKFVSLADRTGMAEVALFPDVYQEMGWRMLQTLAVRLRVQVDWDETQSGLSLIAVRLPEDTANWRAS